VLALQEAARMLFAHIKLIEWTYLDLAMVRLADHN
jgi:hypothetical protein